MPGISQPFPAGRVKTLPYSVYQAFPKQTASRIISYLYTAPGEVLQFFAHQLTPVPLKPILAPGVLADAVEGKIAHQQGDEDEQEQDQPHRPQVAFREPEGVVRLVGDHGELLLQLQGQVV